VVASAVGEVLASAGSEPQLLVTDLDLEAANKARETIAVFRNRADFTRLGRAESLR
jgi:deaminated glutathione amidase